MHFVGTLPVVLNKSVLPVSDCLSLLKQQIDKVNNGGALENK